MSTNAIHYIGWPELTDMINQGIEPGMSIYGMALRKPGKVSDIGLSTDVFYILIAQPFENKVNYCQIKTGSVQLLNGGHPYDETELKAQDARADQAWAIVKQWFADKGIPVKPAMVSIPDNIILMSGWAEFLGWDKEHKEFYRKDALTEQVQA